MFLEKVWDFRMSHDVLLPILVFQSFHVVFYIRFASVWDGKFGGTPFTSPFRVFTSHSFDEWKLCLPFISEFCRVTRHENEIVDYCFKLRKFSLNFILFRWRNLFSMKQIYFEAMNLLTNDNILWINGKETWILLVEINAPRETKRPAGKIFWKITTVTTKSSTETATRLARETILKIVRL